MDATKVTLWKTLGLTCLSMEADPCDTKMDTIMTKRANAGENWKVHANKTTRKGA